MPNNNRVVVVIAGENQADKVFKEINAGLSSMEKGAGSLENMVKRLAEAFAVRELALFAKGLVDVQVEAGKTAQKVGVTTQVFSGLSYAARLAEVDQESLTKGLRFLSKNMVGAEDDTGKAAAAFKKLGVAVTDANGKLRPAEQVLADVADRFANMKDGAEKTALSLVIFGRAGNDLIPLLNEGSAGIKAMTDEAAALGLVIDDQTAAAAQRLEEALTRMGGAARGAANQFLSGFIPPLADTAEALSKAATASDNLRDSGATLSRWVIEAAKDFVQFGFALNQMMLQSALAGVQTQNLAIRYSALHFFMKENTRDAQQLSFEIQRLQQNYAAFLKTMDQAQQGHSILPVHGGFMDTTALEEQFKKMSRSASAPGDSGSAVSKIVNDLRGADLRTPTELLKEVADAMHLIELAANTSNPELSKFIATLAHPLPTGWPDELKDMEQQIDLIFRKLANDSAAVQQEVAQGATSQIQGEQKIVDLSRAAGDELAKLLPRFRELAALTGDPRMALGVEELAVKVRGLQHEADVLGQKMRETFIDSFSNEVAGIVTGTQSIGDAFKNMARAVIAELAKIIARMLIIYILSKLLGGLFGGGGTGVSDLSSIGGSTPMSDFGLPGHALGGSFTAGQPFIAGENGVPELIVPQASGTVIPGSQLQSALGSGGGGNTTYIDARGADIGVEQRLRALETSQPQTVNASVTAMAEMNRRSSA